MNVWWMYILIGLATGVFGATFGVGGGILMVPVLVLVLSCAQKSAQAMSLAVMVPMALVAATRYYSQAKFDLRIVALLAAGSVLGAVLGAEIAAYASGSLLRKLFAVVMVIVAVKMFFTNDAPKPAQVEPTTAAVSPSQAP